VIEELFLTQSERERKCTSRVARLDCEAPTRVRLRLTAKRNTAQGSHHPAQFFGGLLCVLASWRETVLSAPWRDTADSMVVRLRLTAKRIRPFPRWLLFRASCLGRTKPGGFGEPIKRCTERCVVDRLCHRPGAGKLHRDFDLAIRQNNG